MAEERMSAKQYAKFEKIFFLYGSTAKMVSKMITPVPPSQWQELAEQIWAWSITKVGALIEEYSHGFLNPPPRIEEEEAPAAEPQASNGTVQGTNLKKKCITVKAIKPVESGTNANGGTWTLTRITDTDNVSYTTFAGSRYAVGGQYAIEYKEERNGPDLNRTMQEPRDREPGEDAEDIPYSFLHQGRKGGS